MIVVADSSPIIVLVKTDLIDVLPRLFGQVMIPGEVASELRDARRPRNVLDFMDSSPHWLIQQEPPAIEKIPSLQAGEIAAIALARQLKAEYLLMDDRRGRRAALERALHVVGTLGTLEQAARRGLIDLRDAFDRLKQTNFWVSQDLLDKRLRLFSDRGEG